MADLIDDQSYTQRFWNTFAQQLMSKYGGSSHDPNWFMPAAQALIAEFTAQSDSTDGAAAPTAAEIANFNLALYDYANLIPQWAVSWTGNSDGNLFQAYKDYVQQLHTNPVLSGADLTNAQTQLQKLEQQLVDFDSKVGAIKTKFFKDYQDQNMLDDGSGNKTWLPGFSIATMMKAWSKHRTSALYKTQVQNLTQAEGLDLSGITGQIFQLQNKIYGAGFNTIQEAQSDVLKADPDFSNNFDDDTQRAVFQMPAGSDGWLSKYEVQGGDNSVLLQTYKKWLAAAQTAFANGTNPSYEFSLQSNQLEQQNSDAKLSFNAAVPIEEILMIDVSGSGEYKSAYTQKEDFSLDVHYQDLFLVPVQPGRRWFNNSTIKEYGNPTYFTQGSPFATGPLGGPKGHLNLQVNGVLVGVGRSITFTSEKFKEYDWSENFNVTVGVSILGIINLGSGSTSESYSSTSMQTTDTGFVIKDTTGAPSVVGLLVQEIFPSS